jgi:hypothetical protein
VALVVEELDQLTPEQMAVLAVVVLMIQQIMQVGRVTHQLHPHHKAILVGMDILAGEHQLEAAVVERVVLELPEQILELVAQGALDLLMFMHTVLHHQHYMLAEAVVEYLMDIQLEREVREVVEMELLQVLAETEVLLLEAVVAVAVPRLHQNMEDLVVRELL